MEENDNVINVGVTPVSYTITMNLRYAEKSIPINENISKIELRLQQMWRGSDGSEKWEWIEEVKK